MSVQNDLCTTSTAIKRSAKNTHAHTHNIESLKSFLRKNTDDDIDSDSEKRNEPIIIQISFQIFHFVVKIFVHVNVHRIRTNTFASILRVFGEVMAQKHKNLSLHKFINEFKYEQKQARKMRAHKNGRKKKREKERCHM